MRHATTELMRTGAELFSDSLTNLGIRDIFTLVGDHLNDVLLSAKHKGFRIVDMRHESGVVHAADTYARATRRPALALVTGGPGHTNALTGMATANLIGSPVIAVSGSRPLSHAYRGAFQDVDQVGSARPLVKWAAEATRPEQIPLLLSQAWKESMSPRQGVAHLTIPVDVFTGNTEVQPSAPPTVPSPLLPRPDQIDRAISLLRSAERPMIIAGGGAYWADAGPELATFAERTQIPLYTISLARGIVPDTAPFCFGYADPSLNGAARYALADCDVLLLLGKRIDFRFGLGSAFAKRTQIIQVDNYPPELRSGPDLSICADVKAALAAMLATIERDEEWPDRAQAHVAKRTQWNGWLEEQAKSETNPISPPAVYAQLLKALPPDTLLAWDGGDFVHWGRAMLPALHPGGWVRLGPLGTIGAALPNGIGLQLANPDAQVAMITGDGSLGFYIAELDTAVRHGLPIVIIVGNDAGWGLERELQGRADTAGCELRPTRYDIIMKGFGGDGENITALDQIEPAVGRAFAARRPYLLNVNITGVASPFTRYKLGDRSF